MEEEESHRWEEGEGEEGENAYRAAEVRDWWKTKKKNDASRIYLDRCCFRGDDDDDADV